MRRKAVLDRGLDFELNPRRKEVEIFVVVLVMSIDSFL
jgi:hypothetical protein